MEDDTFREGGPLLPRNLTYVVAAVFAATLACMALTTDSLPSWTLPVTAAAFIVVLAFLWVARLDVEASPEGLRVRHLFKVREFPRDQILDKRTGELDQIRSYANWNLKGVKHSLYSRIGEEYGVAVKLKGKRVVVVSSEDAERLFACVPLEVREDAE